MARRPRRRGRVDVVVRAQLDGGGEAGGRDRQVGEPSRKRPPRAAAGLVERVAPRDLGEEDRAGVELGREVGGVGPERGAEVEVQHRLVVGMEVEDDVGVMGEAEQRVAERGDLAGGSAAVERGAHRRSDRRDVAAGVGPEPAVEPLGDRRGEVGIAAVEVARSVRLVAAAQVALACCARPIGLATGTSTASPRRSAAASSTGQLVQHQHSWQLVGMESGLQIRLRARARRPEAQHRHLAAGSCRHLRQRQDLPPQAGKLRDARGAHEPPSPAARESPGRGHYRTRRPAWARPPARPVPPPRLCPLSEPRCEGYEGSAVTRARRREPWRSSLPPSMSARTSMPSSR